MKVLDPQSALLTTAEVHQFMHDNLPRKPDRKIGSYPSVNLHNYHIVRQDMQSYTTINQPYLLSYPRAETFMKDLIIRLKPYDLTKTEVFGLLNLGVGITKPRPEDDSHEDGEDEGSESELPKSLFRLVVEESEQRFEGDEGEAKIDEILAIIKEIVANDTKGKVAAVNGHSANGEATTNGVASS